MKLNAPTVGPIIGYTTPSQTRIFIRGKDEMVSDGLRRCFAAIKWRVKRTAKWSAPLFNKLSPNFDFTGVLVLDGLKPATEYEYLVGWFYAEADLDSVQKLKDAQLQWPADVKTFKTSTADPATPRSYVVGSCRYLLRLFGGAVFDDRGDKAFRSILEQMDDKQNPKPVDAMLMVGDQIYADDLKYVAPDTRVDEFLGRYKTVFSQEYIQALMARVPTYMILDDHEIEDNWPSKATKKDRVTLYPNAIHAYQIYQCSHSPLFAAADGRIDGTLTKFWYTFTDGCAEWFVMDTRTERVILDPDQRSEQDRIISDTQMKAVKEWLAKPTGLVKFIVSSVPVFPDLANDSDDKWGAFPHQRAELIEFIRAQNIRKVVFVSGDVHCSFVSKLTLDEDPAFSIHSVVSSSLFWPYPHTDQSDFLFGETLTGMDGRSYVSEAFSDVYSTDNFARIVVAPQQMAVEFYERKGGTLGRSRVLSL